MCRSILRVLEKKVRKALRTKITSTSSLSKNIDGQSNLASNTNEQTKEGHQGSIKN